MCARDECVARRDEAIGLNITACSGVKDVGAIESSASSQLEHRLGESGCSWVRSIQNAFKAFTQCGVTVSATNKAPGLRIREIEHANAHRERWAHLNADLLFVRDYSPRLLVECGAHAASERFTRKERREIFKGW